jgi:hypothetical protein
MHFSNFSYLTKRLQEAGFGQDLNEALQNMLLDQPSSFELPHKVCFGKQVLEVKVYVKKWKEADEAKVNLYYIQKFHASLSREYRVDPIEQDFYFGNTTPSVTIQQAYNLLCGRAVYRENLSNKDKVTYNAWVQLDFSQTNSNGNYKWQYYTDNYGFDVAEELLKYPIVGLTIPAAADALVSALQQGHREEVTMLVCGKQESYYLEALPKFKSLVICDATGNPLTREERLALIFPAGSTDPAAVAAADEPAPENEKPKRRRIPIK